METKDLNEAAKTEKPAEPAQAGKAAAEAEEVPADRHRILRIAVLVWAALTIVYGITVISGSKEGFRVPAFPWTGTNVTIYYSWGLMAGRNAYGIAAAVEGFLLLGVWTRLHGLRKDGPVLLTAFFVLSFFVYLVYRVFLSMAHSEVAAFDAVAWINLGCTAAAITGSWLYHDRTRSLYIR